MTFQIIVGWIGAVLSVVSCLPYIRDIFLGKTKPHAFSWLIWSILSGVGFAAQLVEHGGAGSWVLGVATPFCVFVFFLSLWRGERNYVMLDWISLFGALISIVLWWVTSDPTWSVVLITLIDVIAFVPTFRKAYAKPHEETISMYSMGALKFFLSIVALESFSIATWFYPAVLVLANTAFAWMLIYRRKI